MPKQFTEFQKFTILLTTVVSISFVFFGSILAETNISTTLRLFGIGTTLDDGLVAHWTMDGIDMTGTTTVRDRGGVFDGVFYQALDSVSFQVFTTPGTTSWNAPQGVNSVTVKVWGAGGGGSGDPTTTLYGSGGGGAFSQTNNYAVIPGNSYTVVVGQGGAGGGAGANGSAGGQSYFDSPSGVLAVGGTGGAYNTSGGSGGAAASGVGDIRYSGGDGGSGALSFSAGSGGGGGGAGPGGNGGNGGLALNGGGGGGTGGAGGDGGTTFSYGGGGGGGGGSNGVGGAGGVVYSFSNGGSGGGGGGGVSGAGDDGATTSGNTGSTGGNGGDGGTGGASQNNGSAPGGGGGGSNYNGSAAAGNGASGNTDEGGGGGGGGGRNNNYLAGSGSAGGGGGSGQNAGSAGNGGSFGGGGGGAGYNTGSGGSGGNGAVRVEWLISGSPQPSVPRTIFGPIGQALVFNSTDSSYLAIGTGPTSVKSVTFWMYSDTQTQSILQLNDLSSLSLSSNILMTSNITSPNIYINSEASSFVPNSTRIFVVVTTDTGINATSTSLGKVGDSYFSGMLDDVRFYDRVLTEEEIKQLYRQGATTKISTTQSLVGPITTINDNLIAHWTFDGGDMQWQTTGAEIRDISGNTKHASLQGSLSQNSSTYGVLGQALTFNGVDDYATTTTLGSGLKTISFWMKALENTSRKIINIDGTDQIELNESGEVVATSFPGTTNIYIDGVVSTQTTQGEWHHVVITDTTGVNGSTFELGRVGSSYFSGSLDDVRVYTRVLTLSEIKQLYRQGFE